MVMGGLSLQAQKAATYTAASKPSCQVTKCNAAKATTTASVATPANDRAAEPTAEPTVQILPASFFYSIN